jgi:hypothetical protein
MLGYWWLNKKTLLEESNDLEEIIIEQKTNDEHPTIQKNEIITDYPIIVYILNIIYTIFIFLLIIFPFVGSVNKSINEHTVKPITDNLYQLLFIVQFILGKIYFSSNHLYSKIGNLENFYSIWMFIGFLSSIIMAISSVVFFNIGIFVDGYTNIYNNLSLNNTIGLSILLFIEKVYSYLSFFINLITFSTIMKFHCIKIIKYNYQLENINNSTICEVINKVAHDFTQMKTEFSDSIISLNYIFSSLNIIGGLSIYFTIKQLSSIINILDICNMAIFVIIEIFYIYSIYNVRQSIDSIKEKFNSPTIISRILSNKNSVQTNKHFDAKTLDYSQLIFNTLVTANISKEAISYSILNNLLSFEWETFNIFGYQITDAYLIQKIFGFLLLYLTAVNLQEIF